MVEEVSFKDGKYAPSQVGEGSTFSEFPLSANVRGN